MDGQPCAGVGQPGLLPSPPWALALCGQAAGTRLAGKGAVRTAGRVPPLSLLWSSSPLDLLCSLGAPSLTLTTVVNKATGGPGPPVPSPTPARGSMPEPALLLRHSLGRLLPGAGLCSRCSSRPASPW